LRRLRGQKRKRIIRSIANGGLRKERQRRASYTTLEGRVGLGVFLFLKRLGCFGSLLISGAITLALLFLFGVFR